VADWTTQQLGVRRSVSTWGRWLRGRGYTPQKAARHAYERDPAAVQRWLEIDYPHLVEQAAAEEADIHWLDESSLRSDSALGKGYAPRGCTPVRRIPGRRFCVNYLAALTSVGQLRFLVYCGKLSGTLLITFLTRLLASGTRKLYVIMDSHSTHRGRQVTGWARGQQERLRAGVLTQLQPGAEPSGVPQQRRQGQRTAASAGAEPEVAVEEGPELFVLDSVPPGVRPRLLSGWPSQICRLTATLLLISCGG
jgi:hypothetical protein